MAKSTHTSLPAGTGTSHPETPAPAQLHGTHQVAGQHQQFQATDLPRSEKFKPRRSFSLAKLTLACLNTVFAIIVLGISVALLAKYFFYDIVFIFAAVLGFASLVWQIADFITVAVRRTIHRPLHPGAQVGVHLILWLLAVIAVLFDAAAVALTESYVVDLQCPRDGSSSTYYPGSRYHYCDYNTFPTQAQADLHRGLVRALTAFTVLMLLTHFVLFVMACVETHRRRASGRQARVVYLVAGTGAPAERGTYYSQAPGPAMPVPQQEAAGQSTGSYA